jgi:hypothetical protein
VFVLRERARATQACPSGNLTDVPQPITDEQRASIVHRYLASGLGQDAFCARLEAKEGIHLASRTLRAWCSRFGQSRHPVEETVQIISEGIERLQGVLERLQTSHAKAATGDTSRLAAGAASKAGQQQTAGGETSEAAAASASVPEAPNRATNPTQAVPAGPLPCGKPGGRSRAPVEFVATEEPPAPEKPPVRRGGIIWELG